MLKLSNLDKLYWEKEKITKGDLLEYYAMIAPILLPYLKNRPIVLHRFPDGIQGENFYQKEAGTSLPSFVKTAMIRHEKKTVSYILIQNVKTLLYVVNLGSIELHPFLSRVKTLENPDHLVLDLDPESISFHAVIDTAQAIHEILERAKIPHFCKTSGGRGLHVYIPLNGKRDYETVKNFAQLLAHLTHEQLPQLTSLERLPKKRKKKVYIDYLQNHKGQTVVCVYSVRGKPHATVSTPLLWKEVKYGLEPVQFTLQTMARRLSQKGDLFKAILGKGISLQTCLKNLELRR